MSGSLVIWWWGSDVRILGIDGRISGRDLAAGEDPVAAILEIIDREFPGKGLARIIYQPDTLETHEVSCPNIDRGRLRKILAPDFQALSVPGMVWSAEPIRAGRNGYYTMLYVDARPRLGALAGGLIRRGLRVEGAWALLSLIEAAPHPNASGGSLSLVATARRAFVAGSTAAGDRCILAQHGNEIADTSRAVRHALARFDEGERPPGWLAIEEGPAAAILRNAAAGFTPTEISVANFLGRTRILQPGGWADLMPRRRFPRRPEISRRLATALGAVLLAGAASTAWTVQRHRERSLRQSAEAEIHRRELYERLASERALQDRIETLTQTLERAESAPQPHYRFLLALARTVPDTMALRTVIVEGMDFVVAGRIDPSAAQNLLARFTHDLAGPGVPWRFQEGAATTVGGEFSLRGSFLKQDLRNPPALSGAGSAELLRWESRLAAVCASWRSVPSFLGQVQTWKHDWTVEARPAEHFFGLELRHYAFTCAASRPRAWTAIVETVKSLCDEPGLTIDRLVLTADPDGSAGRLDALITLTVRLRP